jgi:hypothetical protein
MPVQTILDGPRNVVVHVCAVGAEAGVVIDVSALVPSCTEVSIDKIWWSTPDGQVINLAWDATVDSPVLTLHGQQDFDYSQFGGIPNNKAAGYNGDLLYVVGASAATFTIWATKHGVIDTNV